MRRIIIAGNWKMNKTIEESVSFGLCIKKMFYGKPEVILFPPFTAIKALSDALYDSDVGVGAQNMHFESTGAFTGEISPVMVKNAGANYVLIGHSERRHIFGEDDELINKKMIAAAGSELTPILCVGETLYERQNNLTEEVIERQIKVGLSEINYSKNVIIAYEPVWAIGTGANATPEQASKVHQFIREIISSMYGVGSGDEITVLYGGSVKPENIEELAKMEDIDGGLVGGASLRCDTFVLMWKKLKSVKIC